MRTHKTKIKYPCVLSTLQPWSEEIKYFLRSKYLWFPRLQASLLCKNNNWKAEGTFIHQHSLASNRMKDEMAPPRFGLVDGLADPNASPSQICFLSSTLPKILFHYLLSHLKGVCPSSVPHDPSVVEIHKYFFLTAFSF